MHIMFTVNAAWNIWNFRRPLVDALYADGHQITVLAPPDDSVPELERIGCRFLSLDMNVKGLNPFDELKLQRRLKRIFAEEQPDAVLSYTIKNNIFGARAALSVGVPFVPNVTGLGTAFLSGGVVQIVAEQLYRRAFGRLPIVFFENIDDRSMFIDRKIIRSEQGRALPGSGIDLARFSPVAMPSGQEPPVFLMIGRLLRDKGVIEFVDAAKQIKMRHPKVRFQILGAADSENRTAINSATIQSWVGEGIVEYLGTTNDVRPAIAGADCIVLPSYREGAPRTLIEAAAMSRPLIATEVPGCRSVVDRDVTGFFCNARSADSLAAAMDRFLGLSSDARSAMGHAGRAKMEREFDQVIVVDAYREALSELTGIRQRKV